MELFSTYTPNFKCSTDGNNKGILNSKVGLITYDEVIHAGGYFNKDNSNYYLYDGSYSMWTMSPSGVSRIAGTSDQAALDWYVSSSGYVQYVYLYYKFALRPVININANVRATGTGTSSDPYVIQTN